MKTKEPLDLTYFFLQDIVSGMNDNSYEMEWYLDLERAEVTFLSEYDGEDDPLQELIIQDENEERFIPIPRKGSHEGWNQMERFIHSLDDLDEMAAELLHNTIRGRGAFSRFKDAVYTAGIQDRWYEFRDRENMAEALGWLFSRELIKEEDIEIGMALYEEWLAKRKKREEGLLNMKAGARVLCRGSHGHHGGVTPGNIYHVLDEQPEHHIIRLKSDDGKTRWFPKSHFELLE